MSIKHTIIEQNEELLPHICLGAAYPDLRSYDDYLAESSLAGGATAHTFTVEDARNPQGGGYTRLVSCIDPRTGDRAMLIKFNVAVHGAHDPDDTWRQIALDKNSLSYLLGLECTVATTHGRSFAFVCKTPSEYNQLIHMLKTGRYTRATPSGVMHGSFDCVQFKPVFLIS